MNKEFSDRDTRLTIISLTKNNDNDLEKTLDSINIQNRIPYQVIIKDGELRNQPNFLKKYRFKINYISSADKGIYDAMNIALGEVITPYVLFLNSGDNFICNNSTDYFINEVSNFFEKFERLPDIVFFKWVYKNNKKSFSPSLNNLRFNHQSTIYKLSLHKKFGNYLSQKKFTTADYFFFRLVTLSKEVDIALSNKIISEVDSNGISSSLRTFLSVIAINYIFGLNSRIFLASVAIFHPIYHSIKKIYKLKL